MKYVNLGNVVIGSTGSGDVLLSAIDLIIELENRERRMDEEVRFDNNTDTPHLITASKEIVRIEGKPILA